MQHELIKGLVNKQVTKVRVYKIMALKFDRKLNNNNYFLSKPTIIITTIEANMSWELQAVCLFLMFVVRGLNNLLSRLWIMLLPLEAAERVRFCYIHTLLPLPLFRIFRGNNIQLS